MVVLTTRQVADVLRRELNVHGSGARGSVKRLARFSVGNPASTVWGDPASPAAPPRTINWLDFWYELEQCGRDGWPQLIRLPALLVDRKDDDTADSVAYTREEVAVMLRQAADSPRRRSDGTMPLVTLEPADDGIYQVSEVLSNEPVQPGPGDDTAGGPDDSRQVVFLDSKTLLRTE